MHIDALTNRHDFLNKLKRAIRFQATKKTSVCRCAGCYSERQKHPGKTADAALK